MRYKTIFVLVLFTLIGSLYVTAENNTQYNVAYYYKILAGYPDCPDKIDRGYLPRKMFCELPDMPKNFQTKKDWVQYYIETDMDYIEQEYWMQPEFEPSWVNKVGLLQFPPENRHGGWGYSSYPGDTIISVNKGSSSKVSNFLRTEVFINKYQGMKLNVVIPETANIPPGNEINGKQVVTQDPEITKKYIDLDIKEDLFILTPSFPIYTKDYAKKVEMKINVARNTPPGIYVIGYKVGSPSDEQNVEWRRKYMNFYEPGGSIGYDRPTYQVFIQVTDNQSWIPYGLEWIGVGVVGIGILGSGYWFIFRKKKVINETKGEKSIYGSYTEDSKEE